MNAPKKIRVPPRGEPIADENNVAMNATPPMIPDPAGNGAGEPARGQRIGRLLRKTRESHKIELPDVARTLRIRLAYLEALESGAHDKLPAPVYVIGAVRAYAEYLGLDGEEAVRRFKREGTLGDAQPDLAFPAPLAERSIPGGRIIVMALVLAACGYGVWYYLTQSGHPRRETVAAVPAALLPPPKPSEIPIEPTPTSSFAATPSQPPAETSAPAPATPAAPEPERVAALPPSAPSSPPASQSANPAAPPASAVSDKGPVYGSTEPQVRILVRAKSDSWVEVKAKQEVRFGKLLHAGDIYRVPNEPGLMLHTGALDALAISVDGKDVTVPAGKVKNLALDPARLQAGTAIVAAPAKPAAPATPSTASQN